MWLESEKRSLTEVARSSKFQCSVANISRWSILHDWRARAWAYDEMREAEERVQLARERSAMRRRHLQIALAMQSTGAAGLAEVQRRIEQKLASNLSAEESKGLLDAGTKLERLTLGTEREQRFTKIEVVVYEYKDEESYNAELRKGAPGAPLLDGDDDPDRNAPLIEEETNYGQ
jgi:hypothetical protein